MVGLATASCRRFCVSTPRGQGWERAIRLQMPKKSYIIRAHFRFGLLGTRASAWEIRLAL